MANTNVHTYEAAPVFTLVESAVLARMAACVGAAWAHAHDGLFVPGGSIANLYGARLRHCLRQRVHASPADHLKVCTTRSLRDPWMAAPAPFFHPCLLFCSVVRSLS